MPGQFISVSIEDILIGQPLPSSLYIYIDFRFITFRAGGDTIDRNTYDRLTVKNVKNLFVMDEEHKAFVDWVKRSKEQVKHLETAASQHLNEERVEVKRKIMDLFRSQHPDKQVAQVLESSKKMVDEVMKFPYAMQSLQQLQVYSRGTADHSINVSVLSTYLAMNMGYSHNLILQHVSAGGLLHDMGKMLVPVEDGENTETTEQKMKQHPLLGIQAIEQNAKVPNEVKMIIAQHHENYDGTGFPKKLRGSAIYDLARIVAIANAFDNLVTEAPAGSMLDRQKWALKEIDQVLFRKFDPIKLEKSIKILKLGL